MDMSVVIKTQKEVLKAGDTIEGEITLVNNNKNKKGQTKPAKIKFVSIDFAEHLPIPPPGEPRPGAYTLNLDLNGGKFEGKRVGSEVKLPEWNGMEFKDDAPVTKPFSVTVPGGYQTNRGGKGLNWYVIMAIREKTGMIGTPKFARILPIPDSDRAGTLYN